MRRTLKTLFHAGTKLDTARHIGFLIALATLTQVGFAQNADTDVANGKQWGDYTVHQSVEFGGHAGDVSGSVPMFDTFVNEGSGPRLLSESLEMHAQAGTGLLFDDLSTSSFGYGGDPNDVTMLRISKGKWYDFTGTFRRDRNFFDYDLLANPLNPATSTPNLPVLDSPHLYDTTRKMSDFSLTLLPLSRIKVRLEYTRNVNEGPFFSSIHEGTEGLLAGAMRTGLDTYRVGVDYKIAPRTNVSYDQTFNSFKDDTSYSLPTIDPGYSFGNLFGYTLANGTPADLGLSINTPAGQPCAKPLLANGFVNPTCSAYLAYSRNNGARGFFPTEQFSVQSSYFKRVDISARASYSAGNSDITSGMENFSGLSRNNLLGFTVSAPGSAEKITTTSDLGVTVHITDRFRFVDTFRWDAFRIPGYSNQGTSNLFGPSLLSIPNVFSLATCPPPFTAATCPQHTAGSSADLQSSQFYNFTGQNEQFNTTQLQYDFNAHVGGDIGYRYGHRQIDVSSIENDLFTYYPRLPNRGSCVGQPLVNGVCTVAATSNDSTSLEINEDSLLAGVWVRPTQALRINFDTELFYADNVFTRISPRHLQHYRLRAKYQPRKWVTFSSAINIIEQRNNDLDVGHMQHDRTYNFAAVFVPSDKWSLDLNYSYIDTYSQTNICFVSTPTTPGTISCGTPYLQGISLYENSGNFGSLNLMYKPIRRVTTAIGYSVTSNDGNTLILNPNAPLGPLQSTYYQPTASVSYQFAKEWSGKVGWNYWDYTEGQNLAPTAARNFHATFATASLIWAF